MKTFNRRFSRRRRHAAQSGVALVLVLMFLGLMLLLGLAATMTSITEVNVSGNLRYQTEAFDVADAGATHAFQLIKNMKGDFTGLLRGGDDEPKTGDEFADHLAMVYNSGQTDTYSGTDRMFDLTKVTTIDTPHNNHALVQLDPYHLYELVVYDDADDAYSYMYDASIEHNYDTNSDNDVKIKTDFDQRVLVRSIGYVTSTPVTDLDAFDPASALASAVVDIVVGLTPYPAIISNDDIQVTNSITVTGDFGSVHANDDLYLGPGNFSISQSATFSNSDGVTPSANGQYSWNQSSDSTNVTGYNGQSGVLYIPDLDPYAYAKDCDYIFINQKTGTTLRNALISRLNIPFDGDTSSGLGDSLNSLAFSATGHYLTDTTSGFVIHKVVDSSTGTTSYEFTRLTSNTQTYNYPSSGTATVSVQAKGNTYSSSSDAGISSGTSTGSTEFDVNTVPTEAQGGASMFFLLPPGTAPVNINGNANGQATFITNTNIEFNGNPTLKYKLIISPPEQPPWDQVYLLGLAGEDLVLSGDASAGVFSIEGAFYAHEQFHLTGHGHVDGQVIGYEHKMTLQSGLYKTYSGSTPTSDDHTPIDVGDSRLDGNFEIVHNFSRGYLGDFALLSWRQLHDFDPATAARP